jgi:hypothetical protein
MRSLLLHHLRRCWPGLVAGLLTVFVLASLLQPRPRDVVMLPGLPAPFTNARQWTIRSSDNRYVAAVFEPRIGSGNAVLLVYDTALGQELYREDGVFPAMYSESPASLLYQRWSSTRYPLHEQLVRVDLTTRTKQVVKEYEQSRPIASQRAFSYYPKPRESSWLDPWREAFSLLSPDGRFWIMPRWEGTEYCFERIEVVTGKSLGRLALPTLGVEETARVQWMGFTADSTHLVVRSKTMLVSTPYCFQWFEVATGKHIGTVVTDEAMSEVYFVSKDLVIGKQKERWTPDDTVLLLASRVENQVDASNNTLVVCWHYYFADSNWRDRQSHHETHFSVRDIASRRVIQQHTLTTPLRAANGLPTGFAVLGLQTSFMKVLPGDVLLLQQSPFIPEDKIMQWFSWLQWKLNSDQPSPKTTFVVVDGMRGKTLATLRLPDNIRHTTLSPDQRTLTFSTHDYGMNYVFDYPFRPPWFVIGCWVAGLAGLVTVFSELIRWRLQRRMKTHGQVQRPGM